MIYFYYIINPLLEALIVIESLLGFIAYVTIAERKIIGSMQRRIGPNCVGIQKNYRLFKLIDLFIYLL